MLDLEVFVTKSFVLAGVFISFTAVAALADYAPHVRVVTRDDVAASCTALGASGKSWGLTGGGAYGCQSTATGQAISCTADGACKDYVGDPRWRKVRDVVDSYSKTEPKQVPL